MKRDAKSRFVFDLPEEWEIDCEFCIDVKTGQNDPEEVARINAVYHEIRSARSVSE